MKVTIKDYLNVRVGKPSVNAPTFQYLAPGSEIEIDGQSYKGDAYEGVDTWVKDVAGNYYWSGGISLRDVVGRENESGENLPWSILRLGIDKIWLKTRGAGVKIAIIDTGIDVNNDDLAVAVLKKYNILDDNEDVDDHGFHGSYCSTIAASRGRNGLTGVAPECQLIIIKIAEDEIVPDPVQLPIQDSNRAKGIEKAIELGADIISISFGRTNPSPQIEVAILKAIESGVICICAAGNNPNDVVNYPANIKGVISVGSVGCPNFNKLNGRGDFVLSDRSPNNDKVFSDSKNEGITVVAPGDGISAYNSSGQIVTPISGTSFAAPFVSGVAALWLSLVRANNTPVHNCHHSFRNLLTMSADNSAKNYNTNSWGAGVVNPIKIIS